MRREQSENAHKAAELINNRENRFFLMLLTYTPVIPYPIKLFNCAIVYAPILAC